jgi:hypothetical protein
MKTNPVLLKKEWNGNESDPTKVDRVIPIMRSSALKTEKERLRSSKHYIPFQDPTDTEYRKMSENEKTDVDKSWILPSDIDPATNEKMRVPLRAIWVYPGNRESGYMRSQTGSFLNSNAFRGMRESGFDQNKGELMLRGFCLEHKCPVVDHKTGYRCGGNDKEPCMDQGATVAVFSGGGRIRAILELLRVETLTPF